MVQEVQALGSSGMECPSCHGEVPEGGKFCSQCGAPLGQACFSCGHTNAPGSKFCTECGASLAGRKPPPLSVPRTPPVSVAERRQLTVMFCDLVGSTALSARLELEDLQEVIGAYQKTAAAVVTRCGGFVGRYMGDGILVYFGYPHAHEDDPEQAVRAGLALVEAISHLEGPERLQIRVGIATGMAVVGDLFPQGSHEQEVLGEMPNLAARLQSLASPDAVIIADSTRRLVGSIFDFEDLGAQELKGFGEPQRIWRVRGESSVPSRFEALRSAETPLIGREEEIDLLLRRWTQAKAGDGRVVLLSAEPGVGKSRLTVALQERLRAEPHTRLRFFCSPQNQESALYPIIGQIERAAGFEREDTAETKLAKLKTLLGPTLPGSEDLGLIAELLLIPDGRLPALEADPLRRKEKTFSALVRHLTALARTQPVLMIFEDLHWIDPTSRELLDLTIAEVQGLPVLLVASFRPEFVSPWAGQAHITTLTLNRLSRREGESLVRQLAGEAAALPADVFHEILERADGVPLFLEEVTKAVLETGANTARARGVLAKVPGPSLSVPPTLHASLMARLDRLGTIAKEIAQVGATIGREFSYELLTIVAERPEPELREHLGRLIEAGLVFERGVPPRADYLFKHALIQDAAYGTLLRGPRQRLHSRIAEALETRFPNSTESRPELVARHLTEAGFAERATVYWRHAGELALRRSAVGEAVAHFSSALKLLEDLPDDPARARRELDVRLGLGTALNIARGSAHPEVAEHYARAVEIARAAGEGRPLFRAVWGSWYTRQTTGRVAEALALANELVAIAERLADQDLMLEAYHSRWASAHTSGLNASALADTERGIALYKPAEHHTHAYDYGGHDTGVCARAHNAMTLWICGFPDRAAEMSVSALELGRRLGHPPSLAHAAWWSATLRHFLREPEPCRELAELTIRIAEEQGSKIVVMCPLLYGWTVFEQGDPVEGLRLMEEAVSSARRWVRRFYYDFELLVFAGSLLKTGAAERALEAVEEALAFIETSRNCLLQAEALRLKGACLAAITGPAGDAATWFARALETAAEQAALSLELRAATDLARFWGDQGRTREAADLLRGVYGRFTEGFEIPDLRDAAAILAGLEAGRA